MMTVAKEEGLTCIIEKTIENNINAYPSAVEQLVDVRNILLQNKHPSFDQSSDDDDDDDDENDSGDEENSSNSDDNVNIINCVYCTTIITLYIMLTVYRRSD